ncbi:putative histone-lysine N-methyltransferase SETD3 [Paratrimastix pyriformis]|uniref:Histone-lysine N-methyltransferase SETD3 n=1 Tax=Paratrimastix pyriformis TaxID=342808 RepID=A0ABQ8UM27_9EUKA|nr:putative histone-lysine N-methyltransferase SETD3 [Paratrimastix pyriformis]
MASREAFDEFVDWLRSNGALFPSIEFRFGTFGWSGHAAADIPADSVLVSVPRKLILSHLHAQQYLDPIFKQEMAAVQTWRASGVLFYTFLVNERYNREHPLYPNDAGNDSFFGPYLRVLPSEYATPLWWTEEERGLLTGTNLAPAVEEFQSQLRAAYNNVRKALDKSDPTGLLAHMTWERFLWAHTACTSRQFPAYLVLGWGKDHKNGPPPPAAPGAEPVAAEAAGTRRIMGQFEVAPPAAGRGGDREGEREGEGAAGAERPKEANEEQIQGCLCPLIDVFNHKRATRITWVATGSGFRFETNAAIPAGAEVCNNYASKSNEEFLLGYGFCLPGNPDDTFSIKLGMTDRLGAATARGRLFKAHRMERIHYLGWSHAYQTGPAPAEVHATVPEGLKQALRLCLANEFEVAFQCSGPGNPFAAPLNERNEEAVWRALGRLLADRLQRFQRGDGALEAYLHQFALPPAVAAPGSIPSRAAYERLWATYYLERPEAQPRPSANVLWGVVYRTGQTALLTSAIAQAARQARAIRAAAAVPLGLPAPAAAVPPQWGPLAAACRAVGHAAGVHSRLAVGMRAECPVPVTVLDPAGPPAQAGDVVFGCRAADAICPALLGALAPAFQEAIDQVDGLEMDNLMQLVLLHLRSRAAALPAGSPQGPWLAALQQADPPLLTGPLLWPQQARDALGAAAPMAPLATPIAKQQRALRQLYVQLFPALCENFPEVFPEDAFSWEAFCWAAAATATCGCPLPGPVPRPPRAAGADDDESPAHEADDEGDADEQPCLLPWPARIRHHSRGQCRLRWALVTPPPALDDQPAAPAAPSKSKKARAREMARRRVARLLRWYGEAVRVEVLVDRPVGPGEELCLNYAAPGEALDNVALMAQRGEVLPANPWDTAFLGAAPAPPPPGAVEAALARVQQAQSAIPTQAGVPGLLASQWLAEQAQILKEAL